MSESRAIRAKTRSPRVDLSACHDGFACVRTFPLRRQPWKPFGNEFEPCRRSIVNSDRGLETRLFMYNLPPGRNNNNGLGDILKGVAGILLVIAFFSSPVGGFLLGIFNSVLLLSIVLPAVATVGFKAWQYFNTISGACPSCGAPATVLKSKKDGEATPGVCFNCGATLQANDENTAIENITGRNSVRDDRFGSQPQVLFDLFGGQPSAYSSSRTTTTTFYEEEIPRRPKPTRKDETPRKTKPTRKDMDNVIDAEIEDDEDKPFQ
eukprot:scaffold3840_cov129-Cylindrotheca_fusiformis.AAC.5